MPAAISRRSFFAKDHGTRSTGETGGRVTSGDGQVFGLPAIAPPAFTVCFETIGLMGLATGYRSATAPDSHRIP